MRIFVLVLACTLPNVGASAGFFDFLFGNKKQSAPVPPLPLPTDTSAYADPSGIPGGSPAAPYVSSNTGRGVAYCVRLCDGRFFPMQRHAGATPAQLCSAFCPASQTKVFSGGAIDHSVSAEGRRYADLDNAFVYRQKLVPGCTCNGRDAFGLAAIDVNTDPTLRAGDMVATEKGTLTVAGARPIMRRQESTAPASNITGSIFGFRGPFASAN